MEHLLTETLSDCRGLAQEVRTSYTYLRNDYNCYLWIVISPDMSFSEETEDLDLDSLLAELVRGNSDKFAAYLQEILPAFSFISPKLTVRTLHIALDAHGRSRTKDLAKLIAKRVIDFAIPRIRIEKAKAEDAASGGTDAILGLAQEASALFSASPKSGEGGEVLLSTLAEWLLGYPQLFTKMDLKTNNNVHVHGSDGIHGTVGSNGGLALCWGESKLHANDRSATKDCIESLAPFLSDDGGTGDRKHRDMVLLHDGLSLTNPEIILALQKYLDRDDPAFLKLEHRGLCLIGYDVNLYDTMINPTVDALRTALDPLVTANAEHVRDEVLSNQLEFFKIDVFLVPMPGVQDFRDAFRSELRL